METWQKKQGIRRILFGHSNWKCSTSRWRQQHGIINSEENKRGGGHKYTREKKTRAQWPTDINKNKYNNKNYCWSHGYGTSDPHTSETCKHTIFFHKKEVIHCYPMGGLQVNKTRVRKKDKREAGDIIINIVY